MTAGGKAKLAVGWALLAVGLALLAGPCQAGPDLDVTMDVVEGEGAAESVTHAIELPQKPGDSAAQGQGSPAAEAPGRETAEEIQAERRESAGDQRAEHRGRAKGQRPESPGRGGDQPAGPPAETPLPEGDGPPVEEPAPDSGAPEGRPGEEQEGGATQDRTAKPPR